MEKRNVRKSIVAALVVVAFVFILSGCKKDPGTDPGAEVLIVRFEATPEAIKKGESAVLSWEVDGAITAQIDNGIGEVPAAGETTVTPAVTTIYTLSVGDRSAKATVTVGGEPPPPPGHVAILEFSASDTSVPVYEKVKVTWSTANAVSVKLDGKTVASAGSFSQTYPRTTWHELVARGEDGKDVKADIKITVDDRTACVWLDAGRHDYTFSDLKTCVVETMVNESPYYAGYNLQYRVTIRDHATNAVIDTASGTISSVMPGKAGRVTIRFSIGKLDWSDKAEVDLTRIDCPLTEPK